MKAVKHRRRSLPSMGLYPVQPLPPHLRVAHYAVFNSFFSISFTLPTFSDPVALTQLAQAVKIIFLSSFGTLHTIVA